MAKVKDCDLRVGEFEFQSRYNITRVTFAFIKTQKVDISLIKEIKQTNHSFGLALWFYGISNIVDYLMPNPFLYIETVLFQTIQFSITSV